jgi:hypothetical protein
MKEQRDLADQHRLPKVFQSPNPDPTVKPYFSTDIRIPNLYIRHHDVCFFLFRVVCPAASIVQQKVGRGS